MCKYKVSIGIPMFNAEKYIESCAKSLFEQSLDNIEYIFVDDCSSDTTVEKLQEVIAQYPQRAGAIKIIKHERNRGSAAARNTCIENFNNNENFNLYLLQGKRKYARKFSYYCGQTIRCVYRRLKDRDHHFKEIEHSDYSIWIGKFSNVVPNKTDINVVEKIITSELAELELGFENMMNEINFHPPVFDVYIINQWYHPIKNSEWKRIHYNSPANYILDLMIYDSNSKEMKGTRKIRKLGILE